MQLRCTVLLYIKGLPKRKRKNFGAMSLQRQSSELQGPRGGAPYIETSETQSWWTYTIHTVNFVQEFHSKKIRKNIKVHKVYFFIKSFLVISGRFRPFLDRTSLKIGRDREHMTSFISNFFLCLFFLLNFLCFFLSFFYLILANNIDIFYYSLYRVFKNVNDNNGIKIYTFLLCIT